jgi:hypothetical protein
MSAVLARAGQPQSRPQSGGWRQTMSAALTPIRVETAFWLILWVSLGAGIGLETKWGRQMQWPVAKIAETRPDFSKPALAEPFRLPPPDQFSQMTARPIFIVTRRPTPSAPPPEPPKPIMKKDQFILMGITIAGESKIAFLLEKAGNKSRVVAQGKEINGITVREVTADRIVLSQFEDTEVLVLKTNKLPPGVPARPAGAQGVTPFFGAPAMPAGAQGATPFLGAPAIPAGAQGATPFLGGPAIPAGAQGATPPLGPPIPAGGPAATPPGGRRPDGPRFPGSVTPN